MWIFKITTNHKQRKGKSWWWSWEWGCCSIVLHQCRFMKKTKLKRRKATNSFSKQTYDQRNNNQMWNGGGDFGRWGHGAQVTTWYGWWVMSLWGFYKHRNGHKCVWLHECIGLAKLRGWGLPPWLHLDVHFAILLLGFVLNT